jgi:hypothetical protein
MFQLLNNTPPKNNRLVLVINNLIIENTMGLFNFSNQKNETSLYSGGDGTSIETAIVINTANSFLGIPAEFKYIVKKHGQRDINWTVHLQSVLKKDGRSYDRLDIELIGGELKSYYFDITQFYGRYRLLQERQKMDHQEKCLRILKPIQLLCLTLYEL